MSYPAVNLCPSDTAGDIRPCVISVLEFLEHAFDAMYVAEDSVVPLSKDAQLGLMTILSACAETLRRIGD